jgi:type VI secretion system protein ImpM
MNGTFQVGYFGKLPARADFVKGGAQYELTCLVDEWLAGMMHQLTTNPRWKQHYDALQPLHFAFVGPRNLVAVAGHLAASSDQAGRRFPFVAMGTLAVPQPLAFMPASPLALAPLWQRLGALVDEVRHATDPAGPLQSLGKTVLDIDTVAAGQAQSLQRFMAGTDLAALEALLAHGTRRYSARAIVLGIGLLLRPFARGGSALFGRSLALPLPGDAQAQPTVAAFWLALVTPFLRRLEIELALFVTAIAGQPTLVIGLAGATPAALQAVIDPEAGAAHLVRFDDAGWVDALAGSDAAVQRLSACLAQGSLSLGAARDLLRETLA